MIFVILLHLTHWCPKVILQNFRNLKAAGNIIAQISVCQTQKPPHTLYSNVTRWKKIRFKSLNRMRDQIFLLSTQTPGTCNSVLVKIDKEEDNIIQCTFLYLRFETTIFLCYNPALLKRPTKVIICQIYSIEWTLVFSSFEKVRKQICLNLSRGPGVQKEASLDKVCCKEDPCEKWFKVLRQ